MDLDISTAYITPPRLRWNISAHARTQNSIQEFESTSKIYSMLVFTTKWIYRPKKYSAVFFDLGFV
jgi:hypothetical protein